eukprot:TRINITY_DN4333_c0_g1_i3.p1 TRINITY_DN4333_c0_g1~~TRINITY_DN4333_c0_g1_i3.p1  ORF type:complete len:545 (-),score=82.13 TRINITY_DN4333_c0_g1_i3:49-1683(-)
MLGGEDEARLLYSIEAKNFCNSAVKRHPENILGWITTGVLYTEILEYEIALKYFYKGLELDPNNLKIHSSLATTHSRIGNIGKSVEHMRRAIEMAPTAENLHSQGILRSVAYSNDQLSKISHINASILTAKNRVTKECPNGHVLQFGWENIPMDNKWKIQVTGVHQSDGVVFGAEARLPNTAIARGNGTHLERLQWKDRDVVIVKLQAVHLEGDTGIFSHPQTCTAFTGGHKELSRVFHEFKGNKKVKVIKVPVASILQQNPGNYYHFMTEVFSRFVYLYEHVLNNPKNGHVKLLAPSQARNFVLGSIVDLIGFPKSRILWYSRTDAAHQSYLFTDDVYLADWHWRPEHDMHPNDVSATFFPPRHSLKKIRKLLTGYGDNDFHSPDAPIKLIYITREDASVRKLRVQDERTLLIRLMEILGPSNVHWVLLEGQSIKSQIKLFLNTTIIVSPHGAGLTNMLWTRPGTSVVQFPMNPNTDQCFGYLARALDLDYWLIPQLTSYYYGVYGHLDDVAMNAVVDVIQTIVREKKCGREGKCLNPQPLSK